jgi:hypothetical protein
LNDRADPASGGDQLLGGEGIARLGARGGEIGAQAVELIAEIRTPNRRRTARFCE